MANDNESGSNKVGIIPDFFHDIIAYIIPGYTALVLFVCNLYIIGLLKISSIKNVDIGAFFLSLLAAYVIGRFFDQLGLMTIHRRKLSFGKKFPFVSMPEISSPKWALIFDQKDDHYTEPFKNNVTKKIEKWLEKQDGASLLSTCKEKGKDDYFNLIQFYLRERFPSVALYEKKQNATIALTRSLAIVFVGNILIYFVSLLHATLQENNIIFSLPAACWLFVNLLFASIFYMRFRQDRVYHAMYIFETFIALKKLLRSRPSSNTAEEDENV